MKDNIVIKKNRKRSASYPAFTLEEVIEATKTLKEKLGDGPYARDHMAVALGYKGVTGSSGSKIAACVHFGMLDRNGNVYSLSDLAQRFFHYVSEEERAQVLVEAFNKPSLYQKLMAEYGGKSLPQMLESILIRNYGIQENAAGTAVANFRKSAEFVGVLKNGVLMFDNINDTIDQSHAESCNTGETLNSLSVNTNEVKKDQHSHVSATEARLSVVLPSGLVVSYSQELAPAFAFGIFGKELMELDKVISEYSNKEASAGTNSHDEHMLIDENKD